MTALAGKRIIITRAIHQAAVLDNLLRQHHAIPVLYPCIAIIPPSDSTALDDCLHNLVAFDWLILTSTNAVFALDNRLRALNIQLNCTKMKIAVVGSKTAQVFYDTFGLQPDFIPTEFTGEALATTLPIEADQHIFLPQSALANDALSNTLKKRGAQVISVVAYETTIGTGGADVPQMLRDHQIDAITFTSPSSVHNFMQRVQPLKPFDIDVVCIGSTTAKTASDIGFTNPLVPLDYTLEQMVNRLQNHYATKPT